MLDISFDTLYVALYRCFIQMQPPKAVEYGFNILFSMFDFYERTRRN